MRQTVALAVLLGAGVLSAQSVAYESRRIERTLPGCGQKSGCASVRFEYVEITVGAPPQVIDRINQAIAGFLVARPHDGLTLTPDQYADKFIADYTIADHSMGGPWWFNRTVRILRADPPVISLECKEEEYRGGAHPNSGTTYLNFGAQTGEPVKLADILRGGAMPQLTKIAEIYFRKKRNIKPDEDLKAAGFAFFKNDRFALNENFGVGESSLMFTFNSYEVAPYAWGPTEFEIPFSAIRDLLRPDSGL